MGNTIGYIRVSNTLQAEEGVSLEAQSRKIMSYCDLHDVELIEIVEDSGLSGKSISGCPGIHRVLNLVKSRKVKNVVSSSQSPDGYNYRSEYGSFKLLNF
ncbi:MAG: recombinase family protein [Desulfomonilaceae bacterium]|jgi:site-specific DNA recombinase